MAVSNILKLAAQHPIATAGVLLGGGALLVRSRPRSSSGGAGGASSAIDALIGPAKLKPKRVHGPPPIPEPEPEPDDSHVIERDSRRLELIGQWSCRKAKDQPVPNVEEWVPPQILAVGGPIVQAIQIGTNIVRKAFEQIGAKKVCTVLGGRYEQLTTVPREGSPRFWVQASVAYGDGPVTAPDNFGGSWTFRDNRSDTGPLTLRSEVGGDSGGPKRDYLFKGSKPPPHLWPHVNIAKWKASVDAAFDRPRALVVRSGDDLELWAWIPPRAPNSHVNALGQHIVDEPAVWDIEYSILEG